MALTVTDGPAPVAFTARTESWYVVPAVSPVKVWLRASAPSVWVVADPERETT